MSKRRSLQRKLGERRYKKLIVIAPEGEKTEPQYFAMFNNDKNVIYVECLRGKKKKSPHYVKQSINGYIRNNNFRSDDEAWIVVDKDHWNDAQLNELKQWADQKENHGFALSNPKFEYWLLLHFEDGKKVKSPGQCTKRLKKYLPNYAKSNVECPKLKQGVKEAIARARQKDNPPCEDWPRRYGSTVYRLVEKLIDDNGPDSNAF